MPLVSWCPRCPSPVSGGAAGFTCDTHGDVPALWRPAEMNYGAFGEVLALGRPLPTYVPWPLSPGWTIADVGCVAGPGDVPGAEEGPTGVATTSTTVGTSSLDGDVAVTVVTEEPGVGLGARVAGLDVEDPGDVLGRGAPAVRIRVDQHPVQLWAVPSGDEDDVLARSVFAGEAGGRWLWLVMRPASAALLLRDEWLFADASGFGPEAVEMPFGGVPPVW